MDVLFADDGGSSGGKNGTEETGRGVRNESEGLLKAGARHDSDRQTEINCRQHVADHSQRTVVNRTLAFRRTR